MNFVQTGAHVCKVCKKLIPLDWERRNPGHDDDTYVQCFIERTPPLPQAWFRVHSRCYDKFVEQYGKRVWK